MFCHLLARLLSLLTVGELVDLFLKNQPTGGQVHIYLHRHQQLSFLQDIRPLSRQNLTHQMGEPQQHLVCIRSKEHLTKHG